MKVGANDGITGDQVSDILLARREWQGLLIEPVPFVFERLRKNFGNDPKFILEQAAIGVARGIATFYFVDEKAAQSIPGLPDWYDQLGSFDRNHIIKHLDGALEPFIRECAVEVYPLSEMLAKHGFGDVHLLHIDAEGYDYEVLKTVDLDSQPPAAILIEYKHLSKNDQVDLVGCLRKHGYAVDQGADYFAIHKESPLSNLAKDWALRHRC